MSSSGDDIIESPGGLEDDLFGSDDEVPAEKPKNLSDEELDSGDDEDRRDRAPREEADEDDSEGRVARIQEATIARHPLPKPIDGELNTLRLPKFLSIEPLPYDPKTFKIPTTDHHSDTKSSSFSASHTATSTMRYRKSSASAQLESNTIVYRWSDGSSTIAVGDEHYELLGKPLAPAKDKPYQPLQDSHTYLCSPSMSAQLLVVVGHMSNHYSVRPNKGIMDDALEKLQRNLAAATRRGNKGDDKIGPEIISNTVDPELQKRKAELAEKERLKAQRRRDTAAEKASMPRAYGGRGQLTLDDLEGRGRRPAVSKPRSKPKRKSGYSSDDTPPPRGGPRQDEYEKDGFLATSDEEEEEEDDEEEEEEEFRSHRPKAKKAKISKQEEDSDVDAEADLDDDEVVAPVVSEPAGRGRKRHTVIDDDDDDDE